MSELHRFIFDGMPVRGIVAECGHGEVDCEFYGAKYHFDAFDVAGCLRNRAYRRRGPL
jgi:redox-regulated HSP33 family molecular chaperone